MINSKIALSIASIVTAGSLVAGGAFALFTDTATSNGNVFAAGTLKLALCDTLSDGNISASPEPCPSPGVSQNVTVSFGGKNMAPNGCLPTQTLNVVNNGSIPANSLKVSASNSAVVNADLPKLLRIGVDTNAPLGPAGSITFDGSPVVIANNNVSTFIDLDDMQTQSPVTLFSGVFAPGATKNLVMVVCLDKTADSSFQSAQDTLNLTFTLGQ